MKSRRNRDKRSPGSVFAQTRHRSSLIIHACSPLATFCAARRAPLPFSSLSPIERACLASSLLLRAGETVRGWWFGLVLRVHYLLFLPIYTIESAVGKRLITHCCVLRLACSRLSGHIEPH